MRKTLLVVIMASLFWVSNSTPSFAYEYEIKILSASMADNISKAGKKRIAVVDFTDLQGNITELGRFIAEELSVDLINTAKVISAAKGDIAKTKAIEELFGKGIETATSGRTTTSSAPQPKVISRTNMKGFTFEAKGCRMKPSDNIVVCHVTVINNDEREKFIEIYAHWNHILLSLLYDNRGNQYIAKEIQFGAKLDKYHISQTLPPQLPVNAFLVFENVSPEAKSVSLRLGGYAGNRDSDPFYAVLRDIPLSR
ncbi:MAG: hypothetical protein COZ31_05670 [Nitrospirae bacterium CG_4_10_14_3_um_filter_44_29]|nr:hypothetical protein [Nitrospirota bacterium]PIP69643.1 MAG: hypothetical protein COW90_09575 [Nitrospirae bacterium CG22_combo_CG10-13_8_21_14_all_44_11]PIV40626.1 MAG: hypothetical protein COS28_07885 [Nitrospirae bacterium CG02_land_8_20_14_3_00_44_33]PIW90161.1 MAG: hypothetical protein COZ93_02235 [Nitrospirae bacterium CG_4_8_14_3_um_filter_44_28]PIX88741.1 MAG: hypothetical protein COZ31_05670 [Nitrospirae bacterium CG_4_10_14_3_um_filter_44_29]PJA83261.1 MAG: hypothetical protein CO